MGRLSGPIQSTIESLWSEEPGLWPELAGVLRAALRFDGSTLAESSPARWAVKIPGLCCQAAGGDPRRADPIAAAWYALYIAAHVLDLVQDGDEPDPWWAELGPGPAVNAASGLIFTGSRILSRLKDVLGDARVAGDINDYFHTALFTVSSGQHVDLTVQALDTRAWWRIAAAKSGAVFGLACRAGARLADPSSQELQKFDHFGQQLGLIVQLLDDARDFLQEDLPRSLGRINQGWTLPIAYALDVLPPTGRQQLLVLYEENSRGVDNASRIFETVKASGAGTYIATELENHRRLALQALLKAAPACPARDELEGLLDLVLPVD